jgi:hypothetical protein
MQRARTANSAEGLSPVPESALLKVRRSLDLSWGAEQPAEMEQAQAKKNQAPAPQGRSLEMQEPSQEESFPRLMYRRARTEERFPEQKEVLSLTGELPA